MNPTCQPMHVLEASTSTISVEHTIARLWGQKHTILHPRTPRPPPLLHQHPYPSRIRPIHRVRLPRLKHRLQPQQLHRIDDFPGERVFNGLFGAHAAPLGAGLARVEVERVEALVVLVFWRRGRVEGWWLRLAGLEGWLWSLGRAEGRGSGDVGGADEGVGEVGGVLFWGVGIGVGEFFYSGVLGHVGWEVGRMMGRRLGGRVLRNEVFDRARTSLCPRSIKQEGISCGTHSGSFLANMYNIEVKALYPL